MADAPKMTVEKAKEFREIQQRTWERLEETFTREPKHTVKLQQLVTLAGEGTISVDLALELLTAAPYPVQLLILAATGTAIGELAARKVEKDTGLRPVKERTENEERERAIADGTGKSAQPGTDT